MRRPLLEQLSWEDVKEIGDVIDSLMMIPFDEFEMRGEEGFYSECLRRLKERGGTGPEDRVWGKANEFKAEYVVTESDRMKFVIEPRIIRNAKKHLAGTIAQDIVNAYAPEVTEEDGKMVISYKLRVSKKR